MRRRVLLALLLLGLSLSALQAAIAPRPAKSESSRSLPRGGTLRVDLTDDFDYVDTSLAYFSHSWQMLNATQLKLLTFPEREGAAGRRIVPEAAAGMPKVSRDRKTYTFTIRRGFRFSDGSNVTASNFRAAISRALNPRMQSPASSFLDDVASYRTRGNYTLTIRLTKRAPDFLARMTMPFFAAIPTNRPINPNGVGAPLVSAGPYYLRSWLKGKTAVAVRNPFWRSDQDPWRRVNRSTNPDEIVWNMDITPAASMTRVENNQTDLGYAAPGQYSEIAQRYGVNRGRFFVRKNLVFWYLALNNNSPLFRNNPKLRQAVNLAIDRPQMVRQHGYLGGARTDQILPPGMPGHRNASIYPVNGPNLTRARALARGNTRGGKAVFYAFGTAPGPSIAQVVQFNLKQIGIDVEIRQFNRIVQADRVGTRGQRFDIAHSGWGADYPDPYNFINVLLDGRRIQATNNVNYSYFNTPAYNRKIEAASRLVGSARLRAYGNLDIDIMRNAAPLAPYMAGNERYFVSENVAKVSFSEFFGYILGGIELGAPAVSPPPGPPQPPPPPPPPPAPPLCSTAPSGTFTEYLSLPHVQVVGECAGAVAAGAVYFRVYAPAGKPFDVYAAHGTDCVGDPPGGPFTSVTCRIKPEGRICFIGYPQPAAAAGDSVRIQLLRADFSVMLDETLLIGPTQPACNPN